MKVKVGNQIYTSEELPIMVILTDTDKENIKNMPEDCFRYAQFNQNQFSIEEAKQWMKEESNGSKEEYNEDNEENFQESGT